MIFRFNQFALDTNQFQLSLSGDSIAIEPLVFDLLVYLIENRERVVSREELLDNLWKGKVVTDAALGARLKDARKAVGDSGSKQAVIKTLHGRGYQFVAEIIQPELPQSIETVDLVDSEIDLSLPDIPSVAVLPFANLSGDTAQEFICDGITEDIITNLSRVPGLFVVAHHSVRGYKHDQVDTSQVGREQGVRYVLEGTVQFGGQRVRVSAQLVDTSIGQNRWAERFDSTNRDFLELQNEISHQVVVALEVELTEGAQAKMSAVGTTNIDAWEKGRIAKGLLEKHVREDNFEAQNLAREAIEKDPEYASAWAFLGWTQWVNERWNWAGTGDGSWTLAYESAEKALQLDSSNPDGISLMSMIYLNRVELDKSLEIIEKGVVAYPSHSFMLGMSAVVYRALGKPKEGLRRIQRAIRLCPLFPPWYLMVLGSLCTFDGQVERAVKVLRESVTREPESNLARVWLIHALIEAGKITEARKEAFEVVRVEPEFSGARWGESIELKDSDAMPAILANLKKANLPR